MVSISRIGFQPYSSAPNFSKRQTQTNSINHQDNNPQQKKKTGWLKAAAVGTAAIIIGIGIFVASKGKVKSNKKLLDQVPQDLQARFEKLKGLKGQEFINKAYEELVDYMNLKGVAPKSIGTLGAEKSIQINGGYNPMKNTIQYTNGFYTQLSPNEQINLLSHELKHCEQFTNILRTEGLGAEKYAEAMAESNLKNAINNPLNFEFSLVYSRAKEKGAEKEFLENIKTKWTKEALSEINQNYKDILAMPKIKANSTEGLKAAKDLEAYREYEGLNFLGLGGKNYRNNALEVEAYSFGDKIEDFFKKYTEATA